MGPPPPLTIQRSGNSGQKGMNKTGQDKTEQNGTELSSSPRARA